MKYQYVIQPGDTFEKIALQFYNTPLLAGHLSRYNGLHSLNAVIVGQSIDIPHSHELLSLVDSYCPSVPDKDVPRGFQQVIELFGNIFDYIDADGRFDDARWSTDHLAVAELPFAVPPFWDHSRRVRRVRCHRLLKEVIEDAFRAVQDEGLAGEVMTLGDFYNLRSKRTCGKLSTHCWGIAFDLNPEVNAVGSRGVMSRELVDLFRTFGFSWGGDAGGRFCEPMHFQFCIGY